MNYICAVCGHEYDPEVGDPDHDIEPGTVFDDLPEDWTCPVCDAAQSKFDLAESRFIQSVAAAVGSVYRRL